VLTALDAFTGEDILPLADAKVHLNITAVDTSDDDVIEDLRDDAISWAEGYTAQSLQSRDFRLTQDRFCSLISLPIGPVSATASVKYYNTDGTDTTVDAGTYVLSDDKIVTAQDETWPSDVAVAWPGGVRITFTAGYATAADIPFYLLAAVKLAMTAMFENRSNPDLTGAMRAADQFRSIF
jgi:uncharacterized phiE125 gp8 family phage protein